MPTGSLSRQRLQVRRHLGPASGVGNEVDVVGLASVPQMAVQLHHQVEIFADGVPPKSSDLFDQVFLKDSKRAGDNGEGVELRPGLPPNEKGAQVLYNLEYFNASRGKPHFLQFSANHATAIQNTNDAANCKHTAGIGEDAGHDTQQGIFFQHRVRVYDADVRARSRVYSGIDSIRFAPRRCLIQHRQTWFNAAFVDATQRGRGNVGNVEQPRAAQVVSALKFFQRTVR